MSVEGQQPLSSSPVAGGTIAQFKYVKYSADNTVVECSGVTDKACGVSQEDAVSGQTLKVCHIGETKLQGDGDLNAGDSIGTSADGQAAAYTAADTTKHINGVVKIGNTAAGGLVSALINCVNSRTLA